MATAPERPGRPPPARHRSPMNRALLVVLAVLGSLLLVGCAGARFTVKGGWSGPTVYLSEEEERVIYVGNQEGRLLALDAYDEVQVRAFVNGFRGQLGPEAGLCFQDP